MHVPTVTLYNFPQMSFFCFVGFEKCGLYPFNPERPKSRLPHHRTVEDTPENAAAIVSGVVVTILEDMRGGGEKVTPSRRRKIDVPAGRSISEQDLESM